MYFKWIQQVHAIPNYWKMTENTTNSQNLSYLNHNLIQHKTPTPTSQKYFESLFEDLTLQWKHIGKKNWGNVTKFSKSD